MRRRFPRLVFIGLGLLSGCGDDGGGTGLIVRLDAEAALSGASFTVVISSRREGEGAPTIRDTVPLTFGDLPYRIAVVPTPGQPRPEEVTVRFVANGVDCTILDGPASCDDLECVFEMPEAGTARYELVRRACPMDGGFDAGPPRDGGTDGGPTCVPPSCDDGIPCTDDRCAGGTCTNSANDSLCTAGPDGRCEPSSGCQYSECTTATCVSSGCITARCEGSECIRTSSCGGGQICCGDRCEPAGCEDGNLCTDDSCGEGGCLHTNNAAACTDGMFCNGSDTCTGGSCSVHSGTPCMGMAVCDETGDRCTGCAGDADCGAPVMGPFGPCGGFSDDCDESGTRTRTITTFHCMGGTCVPSDSPDSESCSRSTGGSDCGGTDCGSWSCGGFSGFCDESGTETRTCTDYRCSGGSCRGNDRTEMRGCGRSRSGMSCDAGRTCPGGCDADCGGFDDACDNTGTCTRTCTVFTCGGDSCNGSPDPETGFACTRNTEGAFCTDGDPCTRGDHCSMGFCTYDDFCSCSVGDCCLFACCMGQCF